MTLDATDPISKQTDFTKCAVKMSLSAIMKSPGSWLGGRWRSCSSQRGAIGPDGGRKGAGAFRTAAGDGRGRGAPIPKWVVERRPQGARISDQPPVIPHSIEGYQLSVNTNRCLSCHKRELTQESGAPMISVTHYMTREGQMLADVFSAALFLHRLPCAAGGCAPARR